MATTASRPATEADLRATPDDAKYELVDGEIRRTSLAGARHGNVNVGLMVRLGTFVDERKLGQVLGANVGFRFPGGNVRCPDTTFMAAGRFDNDESSDGFCPVPPDLAVEVLWPGDRAREVLDKVGEYLDAGVRIVWVIDPENRRANRYRSLADVRTLGIDDELDGEDVVPGFRCPLNEIL